MLLFIGVITLLATPIAAARFGTGERGAYFGGSALLFALVFVGYQMTSGPMFTPGMTADEIRGAQALADYGPPIVVCIAAWALGCAIAGFVYKPLPSPAKAVRACPFCAEDILAAATVCKHCGRDLPAPSLT